MQAGIPALDLVIIVVYLLGVLAAGVLSTRRQKLTSTAITDGLGLPFLLQGWWAFVLCSIVFVLVSRATPPPTLAQIDGLTWENPLAALAGREQRALIEPRIGAAALAVVLIVLYCVFR